MTRINDIEQLFRTHYAAMHRTAMLLLRDEDEARDIVHDVFESLLSAGQTDVSKFQKCQIKFCYYKK